MRVVLASATPPCCPMLPGSCIASPGLDAGANDVRGWRRGAARPVEAEAGWGKPAAFRAQNGPGLAARGNSLTLRLRCNARGGLGFLDLFSALNRWSMLCYICPLLRTAKRQDSRRTMTQIRHLHKLRSDMARFWWTWSGSNRRPLPCHGSALPAAPQAHFAEGARSERDRWHHFRAVR